MIDGDYENDIMTQEIAKCLVGYEGFEGDDDWVVVYDNKIVDTTRWDMIVEGVWKNTKSGSYWKIFWTRGLTEYQDNGPEMISFKQVMKKTKEIEYFD